MDLSIEIEYHQLLLCLPIAASDFTAETKAFHISAASDKSKCNF